MGASFLLLIVFGISTTALGLAFGYSVARGSVAGNSVISSELSCWHGLSIITHLLM
jgi:hypothetical protein